MPWHEIRGRLLALPRQPWPSSFRTRAGDSLEQFRGNLCRGSRQNRPGAAFAKATKQPQDCNHERTAPSSRQVLRRLIGHCLSFWQASAGVLNRGVPNRTPRFRITILSGSKMPGGPVLQSSANQPILS